MLFYSYDLSHPPSLHIPNTDDLAYSMRGTCGDEEQRSYLQLLKTDDLAYRVIGTNDDEEPETLLLLRIYLSLSRFYAPRPGISPSSASLFSIRREAALTPAKTIDTSTKNMTKSGQNTPAKPPRVPEPIRYRPHPMTH